MSGRFNATKSKVETHMCHLYSLYGTYRVNLIVIDMFKIIKVNKNIFHYFKLIITIILCTFLGNPICV